MPTELVLLCDEEPASGLVDLVDLVGGQVLPGGVLLEYGQGQVRQTICSAGPLVW